MLSLKRPQPPGISANSAAAVSRVTGNEDLQRHRDRLQRGTCRGQSGQRDSPWDAVASRADEERNQTEEKAHRPHSRRDQRAGLAKAYRRRARPATAGDSPVAGPSRSPEPPRPSVRRSPSSPRRARRKRGRPRRRSPESGRSRRRGCRSRSESCPRPAAPAGRAAAIEGISLAAHGFPAIEAATTPSGSACAPAPAITAPLGKQSNGMFGDELLLAERGGQHLVEISQDDFPAGAVERGRQCHIFAGDDAALRSTSRAIWPAPSPRRASTSLP